MMIGERFGPEARCAVFGASGGIGRAFVEALGKDRGVGRVYAFSRTAPASEGKVIGAACDPGSEDDLARAAALCAEEGPLGLVIGAVGTLHGEGHAPEKAFRQIEEDAFLKVMRINALLPALIAKHMAPLLHQDKRSALALLSARVGSISDNRLGGWHSYRASKAALNMLIKGLSIEVARKNEHAVICGLHPGTVDTALSEPFQKGVPEGKLFTPAFAAGEMLTILAGLKPEDSGGVFDYSGAPVPA